MKGGYAVITIEAALSDLKKIEEAATDAGAKTVVKAVQVLVKFLSTMRSNQLLTDDDKRALRAKRDKREIKTK